jgi:hypothetical protein
MRLAASGMGGLMRVSLKWWVLDDDLINHICTLLWMVMCWIKIRMRFQDIKKDSCVYFTHLKIVSCLPSALGS